MRYTYDEVNKKLTVFLCGEMDMDSCKLQRDVVDGYIIKYSPKIFELDLSRVTFMDSSGVGYIIGRYKLASMLDCSMIISKPMSNVKKIIDMSNVSNILKVV